VRPPGKTRGTIAAEQESVSEWDANPDAGPAAADDPEMQSQVE
jgi:hypothetical protein